MINFPPLGRTRARRRAQVGSRTWIGAADFVGRTVSVSMGSGRYDGSRDGVPLLVAVGTAILPATVAVASGAGSIVSPTRSRYRARHDVCAIGGNRSDPSLV